MYSVTLSYMHYIIVYIPNSIVYWYLVILWYYSQLVYQL